VELTVASLIGELELELVCGERAADSHVRWVHSTELVDPTPWLKGGELLLSTGMQLTGPKAQREFVERLAAHDIAGLGFGTGFAHKRLPAALVAAARALEFPLFEVPYELPFIAITERAFARLLDERYELLQRTMVGDVLTEVLTGHLYPEDVQARLRPFGIGERLAVLAFALADPGAAVTLVEAALARERVPALVAVRAGLLCAVIDPGAASPIELARGVRAELAARFGASSPEGGVRAAASRPAATHSLRMAFHEARCAMEAVRLRNGNAPEVASYADLGAFQLLLSLQDDDALASYCRSVLDPIEQGEGEYGEELVRSLDVFIEHNGHWEKAAAALFCHRHTLRYRIRRVEQLTGRDFSSARDRIEFWLALRGRELAR
jgi:Purine catabolism regulatory protein-like family/PucR C-terminal helix-turn-helix domain/GGDEF-like domain